jgi:hypothetical protein
MKKFFGLLFTLAILFYCSNIIFAAFPDAGNLETINVVANFEGKGEADLTIEFFDVSTDQKLEDENEKINWKIQEISLKQTDPQWIWSTTYAVIKSTVTDPRVNFYLYQKNTESTVYKSTAPRTNVDEHGNKSYVRSGLVNSVKQGGEFGGYVPLSFLFTAEKLSSSDLQKKYDPEILTEDKVARYFTDKADSNFNVEYAVIACANSTGIAFAPYDAPEHYAPWAPRTVMQSKTAYMYFGGNFMNIFRGDIFGTDQIFIEKVVE